MPLSKEVQELFDLVTKPEFLEPTPRPPNKLFEQLAEIKEELCTGLSGILGNYEDLAQSSVLKQPDEPGTSTIAVGVELAPLLTTVKQQCDELLEIGMPKDNVAEKIDNAIGKAMDNMQLLDKFIQDTDQTISNLHTVDELATSLFPSDTF